MATTARTIHVLLGLFVSLVTLCLLAPDASADCATDLYGEVYCGPGRCLTDLDGVVWCSRFEDGDAIKTLNGKVVCGKGRCITDVYGKVFCSSKKRGAVLIDSRGRVRCDGQCELATADQCEHTPAGRSDQ